MKRFLEKSVFCEFYVKITFLVATVLYSIPPLMPAVDAIITPILAWTALYLLYELLTKDTYFRGPFYVLAFLACVCYFLTFLVTGTHVIDLKVLFYVVTEVFLFTGVRNDSDASANGREITRLAKLFVGLSLVLSLCSLALFLVRWCGVYRNDVTTVTLFLGVHPNGALYGILGNSNRHTWFCLLSLAFSFYLLAEKYDKVWIWCNMAVQLVVIGLSQSRGGLGGLAVLLAVSVVCLVRKKKGGRVLAGLGKRLGICCACALVLIAGLRFYGSYFDDIIVRVGEKGEAQIVKKYNKGVRTGEEKNRNVLGRLEMYQTGLRIVEENPLLGIGVNDLDRVARSYMESGGVMNEEGVANNFHNIFLQTAVQGGLLQVLMLCLMLLYVLWQILLGLRRGTVPPSFGYLLAVMLALLAINMVEAELYMARNFSSTVFWMLCGYGMTFAREGRTSRLQLARAQILDRRKKKGESVQ